MFERRMLVTFIHDGGHHQLRKGSKGIIVCGPHGRFGAYEVVANVQPPPSENAWPIIVHHVEPDVMEEGPILSDEQLLTHESAYVRKLVRANDPTTIEYFSSNVTSLE